MENQKKDDSRQPSKGSLFRGSNLWLALVILAITASILFYSNNPRRSHIEYTFFLKQLEGKDADNKPILGQDDKPIRTNIASVKIGELQITGTFIDPPDDPGSQNSQGEVVAPRVKTKLNKLFYVNLNGAQRSVQESLLKILREKNVPFDYEQPNNTLSLITTMLILLTVGIIIMMFVSYRRSQNQMLGGGGFLSGFSKSPAKRYDGVDQPITFNDVAGLEGVKADLQEIVDYLKEPEKYQKLGGRVPKGVLLIGSPGTGKTLLARAVAGEADVPYYSVNGSEFIQMFVGVGASRVRDLFKTAKESSPAIIFIDEIDAVGRQRGAGLGGGHDEREQTLNQILGEMDGFMSNESVIVVAATNRPDVLDPALLRPGRFDRHITVSRPTLKGRLAIFKVHVRDVPLADDVKLEVLASGTVGLTGADIRNIVNEAALWAARQNKTSVEMVDFEFARDKVLMGAKREEVLNDKEKEKTAYHEAGHTIAAWFLKGAYPVHKVTVIPRGQALGVTQMNPSEDRMNLAESEIRDQLVVLLGGRSAEKLVFEEATVGAENDLERATNLARKMVTNWGMSKRLGPVCYKLTDEDPFLGREMHQHRQFSEHTMEVIDEEVTKILHDSLERATTLLSEKRDALHELTAALLEKEELDHDQIEAIIGPSVHKTARDEPTSHVSPEAGSPAKSDELVEDLKTQQQYPES